MIHTRPATVAAARLEDLSTGTECTRALLWLDTLAVFAVGPYWNEIRWTETAWEAESSAHWLEFGWEVVVLAGEATGCGTGGHDIITSTSGVCVCEHPQFNHHKSPHYPTHGTHTLKPHHRPSVATPHPPSTTMYGCSKKEFTIIVSMLLLVVTRYPFLPRHCMHEPRPDHQSVLLTAHLCPCCHPPTLLSLSPTQTVSDTFLKSM